MRYFKLLLILAFTVCTYNLIFPRPAYAYLDPGTGSYIFQILIAGLVGGLFAIKIFWKRIKAFLKKIFSKEESDDEAKNE